MVSTSRRTADLNADEVIRYLALLRRLEEIAGPAPESSAPLHLRLAEARRLRTCGIRTVGEFRTDLRAVSREIEGVEERLRADRGWCSGQQRRDSGTGGAGAATEADKATQ